MSSSAGDADSHKGGINDGIHADPSNIIMTDAAAAAAANTPSSRSADTASDKSANEATAVTAPNNTPNPNNNNNGQPRRNRNNTNNRPKIAVLPRAVVDQIAAGEVVQRPVSVVKELLENSLDACATKIVVQFDGLSKLSIVDNGKGIHTSDLDLLCTRHATSKLASVDDFSDLSTFGFRGEALASTSMVSRLLTVVSRVRVGDFDDDDDKSSSSAAVAYSQTYKHGRPLQTVPKPCARKPGTTITIEDLFYNVPHRQKAYAKKDAEEYGKIHRIVQDYAVHYPTVGFVCQRRTAKARQLIVDCNTGNIPAVKALLQSREVALARGQAGPQDQKIVEATKQILSHVLESNLASHLLHMECSSTASTNSGGSSSQNSAIGSDPKNDSTSSSVDVDNKDKSSSRYEFRYAAEIYFTSPTYHSSAGIKGSKGKHAQGKFVLFLNHRLVDLPPLKRALEDVYASLGNPNRNKNSSSNSSSNNGGRPVLVVNLEVPGCQVDVNVHPSKRQVALMHQEALVRDLTSKLKERLEEDGQAFVAESVTTVVRNPYAKAKATPSSNNNNNKRKRSDNRNDCDTNNGGSEPGDEDENDNDNDNADGPSKKPSSYASPTQNSNNSENRTNTKGKNQSNISSSTKKVAPSRLIRTNSAARAGAIEPFLVSTQKDSQQSQSQSQSPQNSETSDATGAASLLQFSVLHVSTCPLSNPSSLPSIDLSQPGAFAAQLKAERCTCPTEPARRTVLVPNTIVRPKRVVPTPSKYTSVALLRKRVGKQQCSEITQMIRKAFFMGVMSHQRSLVQCDEELVMINHFEMAKELFYQLALARFGGGGQLAQLGGSAMGGGNGGIHIQTVVAQALQCEDELVLQNKKSRESTSQSPSDGTNNNKNSSSNDDKPHSDMSSLAGMLEVNDSNRNLAQHVTARLVESSAMLDEYFSIRIEIPDQKEISHTKNDHDHDNIDDISSGAILTGLPVLLEGHCPQPRKCFPQNKFSNRTIAITPANSINIVLLLTSLAFLFSFDPLDALPIFLLRLATQVDWTREKHCFHGVCKELGNYYAMLPNGSSSSLSSSGGGGELNSYVQHHLFPALSYLMLPSKNLAKNGHVTTMTKLSTLYKVFERC